MTLYQVRIINTKHANTHGYIYSTSLYSCLLSTPPPRHTAVYHTREVNMTSLSLMFIQLSQLSSRPL